jgi:hypothetical protein
MVQSESLNWSRHHSLTVMVVYRTKIYPEKSLSGYWCWLFDVNIAFHATIADGARREINMKIR